jgi:hypothetical protein
MQFASAGHMTKESSQNSQKIRKSEMEEKKSEVS